MNEQLHTVWFLEFAMSKWADRFFPTDDELQEGEGDFWSFIFQGSHKIEVKISRFPGGSSNF